MWSHRRSGSIEVDADASREGVDDASIRVSADASEGESGAEASSRLDGGDASRSRAPSASFAAPALGGGELTTSVARQLVCDAIAIAIAIETRQEPRENARRDRIERP